jgi:hypothetical protein
MVNEGVRKIIIKMPKRPSLKAVVNSLRFLPIEFWKNFWVHVLALLPLIVTLLLQKLQDLVDDRAISIIGKEALLIHTTQYNLLVVGQEIGLAAATSALVFWSRREIKGKQGDILLKNLLFPFVLSGIAAIVGFISIPFLCHHFDIPSEYQKVASYCITLGLVNLVLRAVYVPINAIMIACDQKKKSILIVGSIVAIKSLISWVSVKFYWDGNIEPSSILGPMLMIAIGTLATTVLGILYSFKVLSKLIDGWNKVEWKPMLNIWLGELGIASVSALLPLFYTFLLARANTTPGFFVTYQLGLHLTCMLTFPVVAGMQLAVRAASAEQSEEKDNSFKLLHNSKWWPQFFYASLVPTVILLFGAVFFSKHIFVFLYQYEIPQEHFIFIPMFYCSWIIWQFGSIFLVMLRASKKNALATRNFVISGLGVQIGLTSLLLYFNVAVPLTLGIVTLGYTSTYLFLNWKAVYRIQGRHYLRQYRNWLRKLPRVSLNQYREYRFRSKQTI